MKKKLPKFSIPAARLSEVPAGDTDQLRQAIRERVVRPMEERAKRQSQLIASVRARAVR
jgi:hypothetical protein